LWKINILNKVKRYQNLSELTWWILVLVMTAFWNVLFTGEINTWMHVFFSCNITISMVYGWWIVQVHHSPVVRSFWVKISLVLLNIPLFFFLLTKAGYFTNIFDAYLYIPNNATKPFILIEEPIEHILFIRNSGVFWSTAALVTTVMVSLRFFWVIFKYRQVPLSRSEY